MELKGTSAIVTGCTGGLGQRICRAFAENGVIFSDGISEAQNTAGEEYGDDRLIACLAKGEGKGNTGGGIGIAEVEDAVAIDADGVGAISIPVTHHGVIAWYTKFDSDVGSTRRVGIP